MPHHEKKAPHGKQEHHDEPHSCCQGKKWAQLDKWPQRPTWKGCRGGYNGQSQHRGKEGAETPDTGGKSKYLGAKERNKSPAADKFKPARPSPALFFMEIMDHEGPVLFLFDAAAVIVFSTFYPANQISPWGPFQRTRKIRKSGACLLAAPATFCLKRPGS